jgi:hypothetical protein
VTRAGIDYSSLEETPYEQLPTWRSRNKMGHAPNLWPIQIHGIVLEVSDDKTTVTICDVGITRQERG